MLLVVFLLAGFAVAWRMTMASPFVPRVHVVNATEQPIDVWVASRPDGRDRWLPLTTALARERNTIYEVADQGDVWWFRIRTEGSSKEQIRVTRSQLAAAGWKVEVG